MGKEVLLTNLCASGVWAYKVWGFRGEVKIEAVSVLQGSGCIGPKEPDLLALCVCVTSDWVVVLGHPKVFTKRCLYRIIRDNLKVPPSASCMSHCAPDKLEA